MKNNARVVSIVFCCALLFGLFTVFAQVREFRLLSFDTDQLSQRSDVVESPEFQLASLERHQLSGHKKILQGNAGNPYQYRILSVYIVEGFIVAFRVLGVHHPTVSAFISFRIVQNLLIFLLVFLYYQNLGLNTYVSLIGLSLLAWGMTHSLYESDLAFNTYFDLIFYLTAALSILKHQYLWIVPITGFAALNRETSGLIPFMLVLYSLYAQIDGRTRKSLLITALSAFGLYSIIYFGLRYAFGEQQLVLGYGRHPGLEYLLFNITRAQSYIQIFATLGILPFMALLSFRQWPDSLRAFCWAIVPVWLLVHPFFGFIAETRYFLVPLALVFVPGTLFGIKGADKEPSLLRVRHQEVVTTG